MKILLVQPSNAIAGAEMSALQVLEGLSQKFGVACYVALPSPEDSPYVSMLKNTCSEVITVSLLTWHRAKSASLQTHLISLLYRFYKDKPVYSVWKLLKFVKSHGIDLIYSNSGLCPIGAVVARLVGIPHVWHIREKMGAGSEFPLFLGDVLSRKLFLQWSEFILCNSGFSAGFFGGESENLKIILNGIETKKFIDEDSVIRGKKLRKRLCISDQTMVIGMIGSIFSSWKEHGIFLEAINILKNNHTKKTCVIFGGSKDPKNSEYARTIFQKVIDLGLEKDVIFANIQTDIPAMINSIDIMMHPTSQEGSGRIVMEAMSAAKPVVGVNAGGVGELIKNGENGLSVPSKRPDLLAEAVLMLIQNEPLRSRIGKQALVHAQQYFELERTQAEIHEIFERVLMVNK